MFESRTIGSLYSFHLQPPPVGNSLFALCAVTVRPAPNSLSEERLPNVWRQVPEPQRFAAMTGMIFISNCAPSNEQVRRERHVGNGRRGRPREVPRKPKLHRNKAKLLHDIMGALSVSRWSRPLSRLQSR
jgi:hypothetical protein